MRQVIDLPVEEVRPSPVEVLQAQGLPEEGTSARVAGLLAEALDEFSALAAPRAAVAGISREGLAELIAGADEGARAPVVARVGGRAQALALFVATLGAPISRRIAERFTRHELAAAWMLDAVASVGAERLADLLAVRFAGTASAPGRELDVLPYSPGYCGWPTAGQRELFARIAPHDIGVTLNDSFLMSPLKSVSGVLLGGGREIHRFRPEFDFCQDCVGRPCLARMATLRRAAGNGSQEGACSRS